MSTVIGNLQELPPRGGYAPLPFKRVPAKSLFKGWHWFAALGVVTTMASIEYIIDRRKRLALKVEDRSGRFAIMPMLLAEKDREVFKQLRINRDEETDLMKNVEGWEVGKWMGQPIYKTIPENEYEMPIIEERYAHVNPKVHRQHTELRFWV